MIDASVTPWLGLLALGALHGINPGMGWLFAVALGLQRGSGRDVWRALPPLVLGHALAIAAALAAAAALGLAIAPAQLRWLVAAALFGMGVFQLRRHRHPRFGGMRVGARDLVVWSFLMGSAHGAGLMALPLVPAAAPAGAEVHAHAHTPPAAEPRGSPHAHAAHAPAEARGGLIGALLATLVHTLGYVLVAGTIAAVVYYRLGLRLLRTAWINVDRLWAGALVVTALLVLLT